MAAGAASAGTGLEDAVAIAYGDLDKLARRVEELGFQAEWRALTEIRSSLGARFLGSSEPAPPHLLRSTPIAKASTGERRAAGKTEADFWVTSTHRTHAHPLAVRQDLPWSAGRPFRPNSSLLLQHRGGEGALVQEVLHDLREVADRMTRLGLPQASSLHALEGGLEARCSGWSEHRRDPSRLAQTVLRDVARAASTPRTSRGTPAPRLEGSWQPLSWSEGPEAHLGTGQVQGEPSLGRSVHGLATPRLRAPQALDEGPVSAAELHSRARDITIRHAGSSLIVPMDVHMRAFQGGEDRREVRKYVHHLRGDRISTYPPPRAQSIDESSWSGGDPYPLSTLAL